MHLHSVIISLLVIYPSDFTTKSYRALIGLCLIKAKREAKGWENVNKPSMNQYIKDHCALLWKINVHY